MMMMMMMMTTSTTTTMTTKSSMVNTMSFEERRRRNGPVFKSHQTAHKEVLSNEFWFGDGAPVIGEQFTAEKTQPRKAEIIELLFRATEFELRAGDAGVADRFAILADKIFYCQPERRCGSLACPECHRALKCQASDRFSHEVLLAELSEPEAASLLPSSGGSAQ